MAKAQGPLACSADIKSTKVLCNNRKTSVVEKTCKISFELSLADPKQSAAHQLQIFRSNCDVIVSTMFHCNFKFSALLGEQLRVCEWHFVWI
jgi:hypothetical protein